MTQWTKTQIAEEVKKGKRSLVLRYHDGVYRDITMGVAAHLDDQPYDVEETGFEVIVHAHRRKFDSDSDQRRRSWAT